MKIKYSITGASARAHLRRNSYHDTVGLDRKFHIVTRNEVLDLPKKCYTKSVDGKYYRTNFAIGFEIEKLTITQEREYPLFRGYETDSSLSSSPRANRAGEAITNILPLVPNSNLKNQIMDMMAEASPILNGPVDTYCGGHINLSAKGYTGIELKAALKPYSGLIYALYKGRLRKRYGNGDFFLNGTGSTRGVINAKSKVAEYRLPSAVPTAQALMKRYSLFYELMDTAVNKPTTRFNTFLERVRPILMRMYDGDRAKVEEVFAYARDFQRMLNTGRVSRMILPFLPDRYGRAVENNWDNHSGRFVRVLADGTREYGPIRVDREV